MKEFCDQLRQMPMPAQGRLLVVPVCSGASLRAVLRALASLSPETKGMVVDGPEALLGEESLRELARPERTFGTVPRLAAQTVARVLPRARQRRPDITLVVFDEPRTPARWGQVLGLLSGAREVWTLATDTLELRPASWRQLLRALAAKARASFRESADGTFFVGPGLAWAERQIAAMWARLIGASGPPASLRDVRVLLVWSHRGASTRYRIHHKEEQLRLLGIAATVRQFADYAARPGLAVRDAACHHVAIIHRVPRPRLVAPLLDSLRRFGRPIVYDADDLIFEPAVVASLPAVARKAVPAQAALLALCTHVFASTSELSARAAGPGRPAFTVRNVLGEATLRESLHVRRRGRSRSAISFGYCSGSPTHDADLASIAPALARTLQRHPHTRLVLAGPVAVPPILSPFAHRVELLPFVPWCDLPALMAEKVDVNLAPLELDNPFCRAKSELKYFEAGAVGIPTVATPVPAFQEAIRHGENGMLAATVEEWAQALDDLARRPELIVQMGEAARQDVLRRYTPEAGARELAAALCGVLGLPTTEAATRCPPSEDPSG